MVAPDTAAHSETHRDTKEREPVKLGLHASVNPDTLPFTYTKEKHVLSFTVENTGESTEIFKIKTTASYLYRIRPVYFKLAVRLWSYVRERQEVVVTYKGADAGPIPLSAKDRITVVFAHALDPRKSTSALWEMHKPFAHLSYAESREYVRVLFVDETGRLAISAATEKSRGGLDQRSVQARSVTLKPEPPRRTSAERDMTEPAQDEKSNNADNESEVPSNAPPPPMRSATPRTPRSPGTPRSKGGVAAARTPSPARVQQQQHREARRSPARSRDPIQSILSTVAKDASAIVCVQYPGGNSKERDEDSTVADEKTKDEDTKSKKEEGTKKVRDLDTDGRRDEVLRKKMDEMRRREDEEKTRRKREEERKEERKKSEEERKRKDEEKEERKRKEEEREERKRKEEEREERKRKEEEKEERKKKDEEREEKRRVEEEDRKKKAAEEEAAAEEEKAQKPQRRTSNEDVKQEQPAEEKQTSPSARRRRVLGPDGHYHDDDSRYLDEEIRRKNASVRLLKKGGRTASRDNSAEDDNRPRRTSLEDDN